MDGNYVKQGLLFPVHQKFLAWYPLLFWLSECNRSPPEFLYLWSPHRSWIPHSFSVRPPMVKGESLVSFGQPLGYYASWALFALSHHWILWLAAEQVYPNHGRQVCFEFAKKFFRGKKMNLEPLSLIWFRPGPSKVFVNWVTDTRSQTLLRSFDGAGFRVPSSLYSVNRSRKWERLWVLATKPPG